MEMVLDITTNSIKAHPGSLALIPLSYMNVKVVVGVYITLQENKAKLKSQNDNAL
jgi:hypothetical protein